MGLEELLREAKTPQRDQSGVPRSTPSYATSPPPVFGRGLGGGGAGGAGTPSSPAVRLEADSQGDRDTESTLKITTEPAAFAVNDPDHGYGALGLRLPDVPPPLGLNREKDAGTRGRTGRIEFQKLITPPSSAAGGPGARYREVKDSDPAWLR